MRDVDTLLISSSDPPSLVVKNAIGGCLEPVHRAHLAHIRYALRAVGQPLTYKRKPQASNETKLTLGKKHSQSKRVNASHRHPRARAIRWACHRSGLEHDHDSSPFIRSVGRSVVHPVGRLFSGSSIRFQS